MEAGRSRADGFVGLCTNLLYHDHETTYIGSEKQRMTNMKQPLIPTTDTRKSLTLADKIMGYKVPIAPKNEARNIPVAVLSTPTGSYGLGEEDNGSSYRYEQNVIVSSRYTLINFLPKSLLEQFRRLANVYFLVVGMIAIIGEYGPFTDDLTLSIHP